MRLALVGDRVVADETAVRPGRGAYVCGPGCLDLAVAHRALARAFRRPIELPSNPANLLDSERI